MRISQSFLPLFLGLSSILAAGQQISAPEPQASSVSGVVTDLDGGAIPSATIVIDGSTPGEHYTGTSDQTGAFLIEGLHPAVPYHVKVSANGFAPWTSPAETLQPGQELELKGIQLRISAVETTVTAISPEQMATIQVHEEEKQRILGVIPNFYVAYSNNSQPLTAKLKFQLALRASTDVVSIAGAAVLAGIDQAADTPDYQQGVKGYGQRFGASYADGFSDILIGGAILPAILHQDPRYFYQGTGTKKSRLLHALSAPFICKGDNGNWQFNYSSIGGDLASSALSNLYYPDSNRGPGLIFGNAAIITGGRIANALAQEFVLRKLTSHPKNSSQP